MIACLQKTLSLCSLISKLCASYLATVSCIWVRSAMMTSLKHYKKSHVPLPKGPYTVGCTDIMTGYSKRGCFVRLFYPCAESGTIDHLDQWPLWAPNKHYIDGYAKFYNYPQFIARPIFNLICGDVHIPAILDAVPIIKEVPHPVIVFSHGLCGCRTTYSATALEFASNGYIVACVEHRDRSACYSYYMKRSRMSKYGPHPSSDISEVGSDILDTEDEFDAADNAPIEKKMHGTVTANKENIYLYEKSISRKYAELRNRQVRQRALECTGALDLLEDINNGLEVHNVLETRLSLERFRGMMNMSKVAIAGHSFGGATVIMTLAGDLRFKVGVALDPWTIPLEVEADLASHVSQPILFVNTASFQDRKSLKYLKKFETSKVERKFITISGTVHLSQCDIPFLVPKGLGILLGFIFVGDRFTNLDLNNRLAMTFIAKYLDLPVNPEQQHYIKSKSNLLKEGIIIKQWHISLPWNSRGNFGPSGTEEQVRK